MEYNGYLIEEDITGYAPKNSRFHFYISGDEVVTGWGESIKECENQIDEINLCQVLKDADLLESSFIRWIVTHLYTQFNKLNQMETSTISSNGQKLISFLDEKTNHNHFPDVGNMLFTTLYFSRI